MVRVLFSPRMLLIHVLGLLATAAAVALGVWQLGAWQSGRELAARDLADTAPVPLASALTADAPFPNDEVGRPVTVTGRWLPASTMQVTGRRSDGRDGSWVVTPLAVCGEGASQQRCANAPAILVVRGWSPADKATDAAAIIAAPTGPARVSGWLQPGEGSGLPDPDPHDSVLPELRIASAIQLVDQDLYSGYVIARDVQTVDGSAVDPARVQRVTPDALPRPGSFTSLRNLLYALEWWIFAGFAVFLWWRWSRDELDRHRAARDRGDSAEDSPGSAREAEIPSAP